jgi:hypothetical protein
MFYSTNTDTDTDTGNLFHFLHARGMNALQINLVASA